MKNEYMIHCLGCDRKYMLIGFPEAKLYSQHVCGTLNSTNVPRDENGDETKEDISLVGPNKER